MNTSTLKDKYDKLRKKIFFFTHRNKFFFLSHVLDLIKLHTCVDIKAPVREARMCEGDVPRLIN